MKIVKKGSEFKIGDVIEVNGLPALINKLEPIKVGRKRALVAYLMPNTVMGYQGCATVIEPDIAYASYIEEGPLKLYVWTDFAPGYSGGLAVALAYSETHARSMVIASHGCVPSDWGDLKALPLDAPISFQISGGG
jgi:hypothetical protein